jgi:glycosyltransferase involved in cell wall biosynthesis
MKKLVLIGSDTVHTYNYYLLVKEFFDEIVVITNSPKYKYDCKTVLVSFSLRNSTTLFQAINIIKNTVSVFNPSVIHIHQANSVSFIALLATKRLQIPKVLTAWGSDVLLTPAKGFFYKKMLEYNLKHAGYFTADSYDLALTMQKYIPGKRLNILIANFGIDINIDTYDRVKENIIYSNRLHKKLYRIDKIILAFEKFLKSDETHWNLIIAGVGEETGNLKQLVNSLNLNAHVTFVGWLDKEKNLENYIKAKLFVSVPESDATSISLLEAMAAGCVPVVSNLPSNTEWINDGKNGVVVKNINENFFQEALSINTDVCVSLNQQLIKEKATKESQRKLFVDLYKRVLGIQ